MNIEYDFINVNIPVDFEATIDMIVHVSDNIDDCINVSLKCDWEWVGDEIRATYWWIEEIKDEVGEDVINREVSMFVLSEIDSVTLGNKIFDKIK